ncbi:MAG: hypothetical protein WCJ37_18465 [Syntrophus sp. (in: bacteria)]
MGEQSRIKFNPVTKEIEIEGSESFVGTYFDKIQAMLSGTQEAVAVEPVIPKPIKAIKWKVIKEKALKEKPVKKSLQSGRKWPLRPPPPTGTARTGQVSRSSISD